MKFSLKFITKLLIVLVILSLTITAFVINKLFEIQIKLHFIESQTKTDVKLHFIFLFQRDALVVKMNIASQQLAERTKLNYNQQLLNQRIPYNKLDDTDFLTNIILNACEPIFKALEDNRIELQNEINTNLGTNIVININTIRNEFRQQINAILIANKDILDLLVYYTQILTYIIIAIFVYFICSSIYLLIKPKLFIITIILAIIALITTIVFNILVFIVPNKVKNFNKNIDVNIKDTIIMFLVNTYLLCVLFLIHVFMRNVKFRIGK